MEEVNFVFMITAHNAAEFVERTLQSISEQTLGTWRVVFSGDASTDGTVDRVQRFAESAGWSDRLTLIRQMERRYKTFGVYQALHEHASETEVVLMQDGDDWLASGNVLEVLASEYRAGWDVVWTNWVGTDGQPGSSFHLNPFVPIRQQPWVSSALFTFRSRLLLDVSEQECTAGTMTWPKAACDQAIALPVLERTFRRKHIDEPLYVYNRNNPISHDFEAKRTPPFGSNEQIRSSNLLYRWRARPTPVDQAFLGEHLDYFLGAAFASTHRLLGFLHSNVAALRDEHLGVQSSDNERRRQQADDDT